MLKTALACAGTIVSLAALGDHLATVQASAQEFPARAVTLMMPYAAGGPGDMITRVVGQSMGKALNQQFVVENTAGAGGTIGSAKIAAAAPDGYALLVMHMGHAANTALYPNLRYNAIVDFEPIGMIAESPMAFVARREFPADDFREMVAYVKTSRDKVTHGHAGVGSASHLCGLLFFTAIGTTVASVPYKGTAPALNDLIGSQFDFMCDQTLNVLQPVRSGLIKAYAATTRLRLAVLPELPTAAESVLPGFEMTVWFGMYAPKDTPKPVIERLSQALQRALVDPDLKGRLASAGAEAVAPERGRPEALRAHLKSEIDKWVPIIRKAGISAE